jgi:G3E family GTPase
MSIPANIITGFLGVGKTTAILNLLKNKPVNEKWAVLVNEFGEVGIDGAIMAESGAMIKEVPGGCMCCTAGVPTSVGITTLLRQNPDRLLIEPTGLGHPHKIISILTSGQFKDYIDLKATLALVDPRNLADSIYTDNQNFNDQLDVAYIIVGNKPDSCSETDKQRFNDWCSEKQPKDKICMLGSHGAFPPDLLDTERRTDKQGSNIDSHHHEHAAMEPQFQLPPDKAFIRKENQGQGYVSCGWIFGSEMTFNFDGLFSLMYQLNVERVKGVMNTSKGCYAFNAHNGVVSVNELSLEGFESRVEIINSHALAWEELENRFLLLAEQ